MKLFSTSHLLAPSARPLFVFFVLAALPSVAAAVEVEVEVEVTLTSVPVGYRYDVRVVNELSKDLVLVSLVDAPANDAMIVPSTSKPAGYVTSYDGPLGILDLVEGVSRFGAGQTVAGFSFESASPPSQGVFATFEAHTEDGDLVSGTITVVPEPTLPLLAGAGGALMAMLARRRNGGTS